MRKMPLNERLKREREKLYRLVEEASRKGTPFIQDEAVMAQNCKVDALVAKLQKELGQHKKNEP